MSGHEAELSNLRERKPLINDSSEPLDEQQQEAIMLDLKKAAAQMDRAWSLMLSLFGAFLAILMIGLTITQIISPLRLYPHRALESLLGGTLLLLLQLLAALAYATTGMYAYFGVRWQTAALSLSVASTAIWTAVLFVHNMFSAALVWLPMGTLIFGVVVLYAELSRRGNHRDIAKVESYRYKYTSL